MRNLFRQSSRRHQRRLPSTLSAEVQALEQRTLPAGTVLAVASAGNITLTGDNNSNQVTIVVTAAGITLTGTDGTLIRKGARTGTTLTLNTPNVTRDVTINLRGGDDALTVNVGTANLVIGRNLKIDASAGNDTINVPNTTGSITVNGELTVDLGTGTDRLTTATPITVLGNARITGNTGNDTINLDGLNVLQHLTIETGSGDDAVALTDSLVTGNANVALSGGNDDLDTNELTVLGATIFDAGAGDDSALSITDSLFAGRTRFHLQSGNDQIELSSEFQGVVEVTGGIGNDLLGIGASIFRAASSFHLGDGDDIAFIDDAEFFGNTSFDFGDGLDLLDIGSVDETLDVTLTPIFRARSSFHLGGGNDSVRLASANFQGRSTLDLGSGDDELGIFGTPPTRGEDVVVSVIAGEGLDRLEFVLASLTTLDLEALAALTNTVFENKVDLNDE